MDKLIWVFFALFIEQSFQGPYKAIKLLDNKISLRVPNEWKVKEHAMLFTVYEIKYDVAVQDPKTHSSVALYVFNPRYGPRMQITDSIVAETKQSMISDPIRKIVFEESGLKVISGIQVGYLKYTFQARPKYDRSYGIELFYCDKRNIYHKIKIVGLNRRANDFRKVAEEIFNSIIVE